MDYAHLRLENPVNATLEQVAFRAELWRKFVAGYQSVLAQSPESFSAYCEVFGARWIAGRWPWIGFPASLWVAPGDFSRSRRYMPNEMPSK
jgi:hypothetical protein